MTATRRLPRALASLFGLGALVGGVPALLVGIAGWPLPHAVPTVEQVRTALDDGWRPDERFVMGFLAVLLWLLWSQVLRHVIAQVRFQLRLRRTTTVSGDDLLPQVASADARRRGPVQRLVGWLVGGLMMASPLLPTAALSAPAPRIPVVLTVTRAMADPLVSPSPRSTPALATTTPETPAPMYVVRTWEENRDCLWSIAERYLGDPFRWHEIYELNQDRVQPDGRQLGDDARKWVYPGWVLVLPSDAIGPEVGTTLSPVTALPSPPVVSAPTTSPPTTSRVVPPTTTAVPPSTVGSSRPLTSLPASAPATSRVADSYLQTVKTPPAGNRSAAIALRVLPPVLAGAVLAELGRRRLAQHRRRRRGRDVARASAELQATERRLRAIGGDDALEWVDLGLRYLWSALADSAIETPPAVLCVRAGELGLEVVVDPPVDPAPPGFETLEGGALWRLEPGLELHDLRQHAQTEAPLLPAMVTAGMTPEGCVLIDLERAGSVSVEGDPAKVEAFLAGVALELTTAPWASETSVVLMGGDRRLAVGSSRVSLADNLEGLTTEMQRASISSEDSLASIPSTLAARVAPGNAEGWAPAVIVVGPGVVSADELADLVDIARPDRSGVVLVAPGPLPSAGWRLLISADGEALLHPLGLELSCRLDRETIAGAAGLLAARADHEDVAQVVELASVTDRVSEQHADVPSIRVCFLRRQPVVEWPGGIDPDRGSKLAEFVHYLAAADGPVSGERLQSALWPVRDGRLFDEISKNTFSTLVSRVRAALGNDVQGRPILPKPRDGFYQLGPAGWTSDWAEFQALVHRAELAPLAEGIDLLAEALSLLKDGPVFSDLPTGAYGWVFDGLVDDIMREVADAAETLAEKALITGDRSRVELAARKGLAVTPSREPLWRARMQAAADSGDRDAVDAAFRGAQRAARSLDPLAEPEEATTRLYEALRRTGGRSNDGDGARPSTVASRA